MSVLYYVEKKDGEPSKVHQVSNKKTPDNSEVIEQLNNHLEDGEAHANGISGVSTDVYLEEYGKTAKELGQIGKVKTINGTEVDCNSLIEPGYYYILSSSENLHYPNGSHLLEVYTSEEGYIWQRVTRVFGNPNQVFSRISEDNGVTFKPWSIENYNFAGSSDINIYISKTGSDLNLGLIKDFPVQTFSAALKQAQKISTNTSVNFCFGSGDWGDITFSGNEINSRLIRICDFNNNVINDPTLITEELPRFGQIYLSEGNYSISNIRASYLVFSNSRLSVINYSELGGIRVDNSLVGIGNPIKFIYVEGNTNPCFRVAYSGCLLVTGNKTIFFEEGLTNSYFLSTYEGADVFISNNTPFEGIFNNSKYYFSGDTNIRGLYPSNFPGAMQGTGTYCVNGIPQSGVVLTSGNQEISGVKTFQVNPVVKNGYPQLTFINTNIEKTVTPTEKQNGFIPSIRDKNNEVLAALRYELNTNNKNLLQLHVKDTSSSDNSLQHNFSVYYENGIPWCSCSSSIIPVLDNTSSLGISTNRWNHLFATTPTINTSDEREKTSILNIPDEILDAWGEVNWQQYQFNDAVESKGLDNARLHTGIIAQRILEVFNKHNLDATKYGLLCYDSWEAEDWDETVIDKEAVIEQRKVVDKPSEYDSEGNILSLEEYHFEDVIIEPEESHVVHHHRDAGDRYGVRYEEALALEAAYQRRRADRLEELCKKLEERVSVIERRLG